MLFIIARHGKTDLNEMNICSGQRAIANLNESGLCHAEALAIAMAYYDIDAVYSSPLPRARMTAEPTAKSKGLEIIIEPRIIEMDFGESDGMSSRDPFVMDQMSLRFSSNDYKMIGGESYGDVVRRAGSYYADLVARGHSCVLHVAHLGFNRALINVLTGIPLPSLRPLSQDNNYVYIFDTDSKKMTWMHTQTKEKGDGFVYQN